MLMEPAATRPDRMLWLAWLIENTREPCHREQLARAIEIRERRLQGVPEYRQPAGPLHRRNVGAVIIESLARHTVQHAHFRK
jgi:hypothetical protein